MSSGLLPGIRQAHADRFNCLGLYSDAGGLDCAELRFAKTEGPSLHHGFKVPTLRNLASTAPYMHDGRFATLAEALEHYAEAPSPTGVGTELEPLALVQRDLDRLAAFLLTLDGPIDAPAHLLWPPLK